MTHVFRPFFLNIKINSENFKILLIWKMLKEMFIIIFFLLFPGVQTRTIIPNKRLVILYSFKNTDLPVDIILGEPGTGSLYGTPRPLISIFTETEEVEHTTGIHFSCKKTTNHINKQTKYTLSFKKMLHKEIRKLSASMVHKWSVVRSPQGWKAVGVCHKHSTFQTVLLRVLHDLVRWERKRPRGYDSQCSNWSHFSQNSSLCNLFYFLRFPIRQVFSHC